MVRTALRKKRGSYKSEDLEVLEEDLAIDELPEFESEDHLDAEPDDSELEEIELELVSGDGLVKADDVVGDCVGFIMKNAGKFELLSAEAERDLTRRIYFGKIKLLSRLDEEFDGITEDSILTAHQKSIIFNKFEEWSCSALASGIIRKSDPDYHSLKRDLDSMLQQNQRLVVNIATKLNFHHKFPDSIQWGMIGLMKAINLFDYRRGYKFATYATWWVRQTIFRFYADDSTIRIPVHAGEAIRKLNKLKRKNPDMVEEELAELAKMPLKKVRELLRADSAKEPMSFDSPVVDGDTTHNSDLIKFLADGSEPADNQVIRKFNKEHVNYVIDEVLTEREKLVIRRRFGIAPFTKPETLEEIANSIGVVRERIRQNEAAALKKLMYEFIKY